MQQNHSDCSRVAQYSVVLGLLTMSSQISLCMPNPSVIQSAQEFVKPKSTCMAPQASAIKEQGFSGAVTTQIEAPQSRSTRSLYEAK